MYLRRCLKSLAWLCATSALTVAASPGIAATTLTFGEAGGSVGVRAEATKDFAKRVEELTGGEVVIDIVWGGALFKAPAATQSIGDGVADMGTIIAVYKPSSFPAYTVADLPLANPDAWVSTAATNTLMYENKAIQKNLARQNLAFLGAYTSSAVQIICNGDPIRSIADIDGKKVRGVGNYGKVFGDLGANIVNVSFYEAYSALDTGLIDCSQTYAYATKALKHYEVADKLTRLDWGQTGAIGAFINLDSFESLTAQQQTMLQKAALEMSENYARVIGAANESSYEAMAEVGVELIDLSEEDRTVLLDRSTGYIDDWIKAADKAGFDGAEVLNRYKDLIKQYTTEYKEQGYPWER